MKIAVVGAGFSGAVVAHELANAGYKVNVFESRSHIGGNCYTEKDAETDIIIHKYGPHIFHTDDDEVWSYVTKFAKFQPYVNRVKINYKRNVYSLPVNLHTINQLYQTDLNPAEAKDFIESKSEQSIAEPKSFEDQALKFLGRDIYEAFFKGYTKKQWGREPSDLPASILKRLPVRFNYDDNYFTHPYQGMPENGYTEIFDKLLSHKNISMTLSCQFNPSHAKVYDQIFYTGPIDAWFDYSLGQLPYRTLDFVREDHHGDYQGCAVMNYGDESVPWTRISEHKHFSPWRAHERTVIFKEYSRECTLDDTPYYPVRQVEEKKLLNSYLKLAEKESNVVFMGRLGTYRYLDMDKTIREALDAARYSIDAFRNNKDIPPFLVDPT